VGRSVIFFSGVFLSYIAILAGRACPLFSGCPVSRMNAGSLSNILRTGHCNKLDPSRYHNMTLVVPYPIVSSRSCSGDSRVLCGTDDSVSVYLVDPDARPPLGGYEELGCVADLTTGVRVRDRSKG